MRIVNGYAISPGNIRPGDNMLYVIKALVTRPGRYRLYRCPYPSSEELPQGDRVFVNEREICEALFPSLAAVAEPD